MIFRVVSNILDMHYGINTFYIKSAIVVCCTVISILHSYFTQCHGVDEEKGVETKRGTKSRKQFV
jgi:hypothetical protein